MVLGKYYVAKERYKMLGTIIGDIAGSRFEWHNYKSKDFELFTYKCHPTDDSIMSLAVANAMLASKEDYSDLAVKVVEQMQSIGRQYPHCGFGGSFAKWVKSEQPVPYNSFGNGSAMRISPVGFAAGSLDEAIRLSHTVTAVTHNHPEEIKGAETVAVAIYMAKTGTSLADMRI